MEELIHPLSSTPMLLSSAKSCAILRIEEFHLLAAGRKKVANLDVSFDKETKEKWSFHNWLLSLDVFRFPSVRDQRLAAQREEEESLCVWQAPRQSWIIYLFCNSFLSNILFLSLVIKNWNASFSVDDLILTICLTLDKLFNLCSWMEGQCLTQRRHFTSGSQRLLIDLHLQLPLASLLTEGTVKQWALSRGTITYAP